MAENCILLLYIITGQHLELGKWVIVQYCLMIRVKYLNHLQDSLLRSSWKHKQCTPKTFDYIKDTLRTIRLKKECVNFRFINFFGSFSDEGMKFEHQFLAKFEAIFIQFLIQSQFNQALKRFNMQPAFTVQNPHARLVKIDQVILMYLSTSPQP